MTKQRTSTKTPPSRRPKTEPKVFRNAFGQVEVPRGHPEAHNYRPARDCTCRCCRMQRAQFRARLVADAVARAWDLKYPYGSCGRVRVGANATAEMLDVLGGER